MAYTVFNVFLAGIIHFPHYADLTVVISWFTLQILGGDGMAYLAHPSEPPLSQHSQFPGHLSIMI